MTQAVPYAPWVTMMRRYFGLGADDVDEEASAKIAGTLRLPAEEVAASYPGLSHVLGLRGPRDGVGQALLAEELKRKEFHAVARVVDHAGAHAPVVMVIEEVQWMDEPSREMLAVVSKTTARLMILTTHRPDHQPTWRVRQAFTQLVLNPLSDDETTEVVRGVASGALPAELERLVRKAEGNPFFAEEITARSSRKAICCAATTEYASRGRSTRIRMPGTVEG